MKILYVSACAILLAAVVFVAYVQASSEESENIVRVTVFANTGHLAPIVGIERGIFAQYLGNTSVEYRVLDSGPQAVESLFSHSSDLAYVGPGPAINGYVRSGGDVVVLAGAASGGASFVVRPDSGIKSVADLGGKRVAAPQIANTQDVSLRHELGEYGLHAAEYGGTVYVINVPNPDIYTLFARGSIDAAWIPEPWATLLVSELGAQRLFAEEQLWEGGKFSSVLLVARAQYADENPDVVKKWLQAHSQSAQWAAANPEESADILYGFAKKELGASLERDVIAGSLAHIETTSEIFPHTIEEFASRADSLGYLGRTPYSLDGLYYRIGEQ